MVRLKQIFTAIQARVQKGVSVRGSFVFSILLHFGIAVVFAGIYAGKALMKPAPEPEIVFELESEKDVKFVESASGLNLSNDSAGKPNSTNATESSPKSRRVKWSDSDKLIAENVQTDKKQILMASLVSLSDMRESFAFAVIEMSANENGAFTPIHGDAPDTGIIANGLGDGMSLGARIRAGVSGGGHCSGPPILR